MMTSMTKVPKFIELAHNSKGSHMEIGSMIDIQHVILVITNTIVLRILNNLTNLRTLIEEITSLLLAESHQ
jgi:hypothetical protein